MGVYLGKIEDRPDIKEAVATLQTNEEGVPIAWGQHLPSVDVSRGLLHHAPRRGAFGSQLGRLLGHHLAALSGGRHPFFTDFVRPRPSSGSTRSCWIRRGATATQEIRQFYDSFAADQKQITKLEETADLGKKNYEALIKEYRNGLVTNLEVLTGITAWQDTLRTLAHQQPKAKQDYVKLQAASAGRKEIYIESTKVQ